MSDSDAFPRFPDIEVRLVGEDGNAYAVLGAVLRALRQAEVPEAVVQEFLAEATAGDYDYLLQTVVRWVEVG